MFAQKSSILESCSYYYCFRRCFDAVDHVCFHFSLAEFMPQVKVEPVETVEGCTHEVLKQIPANCLREYYSFKRLYLNFHILCQMMINNLKEDD